MKPDKYLKTSKSSPQSTIHTERVRACVDHHSGHYSGHSSKLDIKRRTLAWIIETDKYLVNVEETKTVIYFSKAASPQGESDVIIYLLLITVYHISIYYYHASCNILQCNRKPTMCYLKNI